MSQELKVNEIYKAMLAFAGAEADEKGFIFQTSLGGKTPMVVSGKSVVLPYRENLRNPKGNAIFHPLGEVVVRSESEVLARYRKWINLRLNNAIQGMIYRLLRLVASTEVHKRLTPEQSEVIYQVTDVDEKSYVNFCKTALKVFADENKLESGFVNIYLRRGGDYLGKKTYCAGVTTFQFYQRLLSEDAKADIGCRVSDVKAWRKMFEFLFPDIGEKEAYNFGSYSEVAKYSDALIGAAVKVAESINQYIRIFRTEKGNLLDEMTSEGDVSVESLYFDTSVTEWFRDIDSHRSIIGEVPVQTEPSAEEPAKPTLAGQPAQPKSLSSPKKGLTLKDVEANRQMQQPAFGGGFGFNQPQGGFNQPRASFGGGFSNARGFNQPTDPLVIAQMQEQMKNNPQTQFNNGFGNRNASGMTPGSRVSIPNAGDFIVSADGSLVPVGGNAPANSGFTFGQTGNRSSFNNDFQFGNINRR